MCQSSTQTLSLLTALCYPTKLKGFDTKTCTGWQLKCATGHSFGWPNFPILQYPQNVCQVITVPTFPSPRAARAPARPPCSARCPRRRCSSPAAPCRVAAAHRGGRPLPHDSNTVFPLVQPPWRLRSASCRRSRGCCGLTRPRSGPAEAQQDPQSALVDFTQHRAWRGEQHRLADGRPKAGSCNHSWRWVHTLTVLVLLATYDSVAVSTEKRAQPLPGSHSP